MPKIISIKDKEPFIGYNFFISLRQSFLRVSKFDKLMLIAFFLIIVVTPYIISNNQIFTSRAASVGDIPTSGLVGHWPLNEASGTTANDSSGNGYNGTLVNNPAWVTGIAGNALNFTTASGSANNYVSFPSSLQNTSFPTNGTLAFWIKGDFASQNSKCVFDCYSARNHIFVIKRLGGVVQIVLQDSTGQYLNQLGSSKYTNPAITTSYDKIPISPDTWTHIAVSWDTTNDMGYIYKDGVLAISFFFGAYNSAWTPSTQVFKINDASAASTETIDDVALFNRSLSSSEIQSIFAGTTPPPVDTQAPSAPNGLATSSISPGEIALGWDASNDDVAIGGYIIYRNGVPAGKASPTALSYTDTGLTASTSYTYTVYAFDASGNRSASSASVGGTTTATNLLYKTDFEQNSTLASAGIGGWNQWGPNDEAVTVTTEQARAGSKAVKFNFNYSDWDGADTNNHERAEISQTATTEFKLGQTYWVGFSQYIPTTWQNELSPTMNRSLIWQFHGWGGGPGDISPPLALYIGGDTESFEVRHAWTNADGTPSSKSKVLATMPIDPDKGQWIDWVLQVNFNFEGGMVKAWKNGVQVVDYQGSTIYHTATETNQKGPYVDFAVYKWGWGESPTQVSNLTLYTDEIRIGDNTTSCNDVKPMGSLLCEDTIAPVISITAPVDSSTVSGVATIDASATDNIAVSKVEFYTNAELLSTDTIAPYSAQWDTTLSTPGNHVLMAKAYDDQNNIGTSSDVTITVVDVILPVVSITSPVNNATVSGNVSIDANASDANGISKVEFYVDGGLILTDTAAPYTTLWNTASYIHNSNHTLTAKAYDTANNVATSSSVLVKVIDITLPTVAITSPANNSTVPRNTNVTIQASASDISGISKVQFLVNNILKCTDTTSPYSCVWNVPNGKNITYTLQAKAYDIAGNIKTATSVVTSSR